MIRKEVVDRFAQPPFILSLILIGLFAWAYSADTSDATMKGALLAAFSAAWGYFIGSSQRASSQNDNLGKALDLASAPNVPQKVEVTNGADRPVPVEGQ